jgi:hypothetical protein
MHLAELGGLGLGRQQRVAELCGDLDRHCAALQNLVPLRLVAEGGARLQ